MEIPLPKLQGYVIYNPATEKFSKGGYGPKWGNTPKIWTNIGHLKNHLNYAACRYGYGHNENSVIVMKYIYQGCVVLDITTKSDINFDIEGYIREDFEKSYQKRKQNCVLELY
jgi:hypothetical protein